MQTFEYAPEKATCSFVAMPAVLALWIDSSHVKFAKELPGQNKKNRFGGSTRVPKSGMLPPATCISEEGNSWSGPAR